MAVGAEATQPLRVNSVHKLGPTHARGLDRLAGLYSDIRQGEPLNDMKLDFELNCGIASLVLGDQNFELALRTCQVSLERENCEIRVGSTYESWLTRGKFEKAETERSTKHTSNNAGAKLGAEVDATTLTARLVAKLGIGASRSRRSDKQSVTKKNTRVELVVTNGQDRWRIGDPLHGDARRSDRILSGAYFREEQTADGDPAPLCRLAIPDSNSPTRVTIAVTASFGSLLVFKDGMALSERTSDRLQALALLKRRSRRAEAAHAALVKAYLAGLVAAKKLRDAQVQAGVVLLENEFLIARLTLDVSTTRQ